MARRYQKPPAGDTSEEAMIQFANWLAEDIAALPSGEREEAAFQIRLLLDMADAYYERRIAAANAWQPTAADHEWLLNALEYTPQDEPRPS